MAAPWGLVSASLTELPPVLEGGLRTVAREWGPAATNRAHSRGCPQFIQEHLHVPSRPCAVSVGPARWPSLPLSKPESIPLVCAVLSPTEAGPCRQIPLGPNSTFLL